MSSDPATSEAEARWPRFGLVVVATYSRRDNKDQMITPYELDLPLRSLPWVKSRDLTSRLTY
jgi:hypothetical protein